VRVGVTGPVRTFRSEKDFRILDAPAFVFPRTYNDAMNVGAVPKLAHSPPCGAIIAAAAAPFGSERRRQEAPSRRLGQVCCHLSFLLPF
jgi:hypothetical protein